ncbi:hypothetical protein WG66_007653 [Moniliophthora roreri]|uniref:USP domain-containing protein n=1 Tax=Moniliophthora roreri TaxID=221103 RepID=A0A0W0F3X8_MONRR|nr:hypothetical protein WG66_007653 [Moniliophthora roreri]
MLDLWYLFLPVVLTSQACSQNSESGGTFSSPRTGVKWRYWLQDASADLDIIRSDMAEIAKVGSSGLEWLSYQSYGGVQSNTGHTIVDPTDYAFGSERFVTVTSTMIQAAIQHNLTVDFALGPAQGAGIPVHPDDVDKEGMLTELVVGHRFLNPGESNANATKRILVAVLGAQLVDPSQVTQRRVTLDHTTLIDLTKEVQGADDSHTVSWTPETNTTNVLLAYYYRRNGFPEAVGGFNGTQDEKPGSWGAFVVDHFSPTGVNVSSSFIQQNILSKDEIGEMLAQPGVGKYMWEDSVEFQGQVWWTDSLADRFSARKGYTIQRVLPILHTLARGRGQALNQTFQYSDRNISLAFLEDYRDTTTSLYLEYISAFNEWSHSVGMEFSHQPAYGFDLDVAASASIPNVPEIESLGVPSIDEARQLSGGVHLGNHRLLSSEIGARVFRTVRLSMAELLEDCKRQFASGVNLAVLHGYPYSGAYPETTWPGIATFAYNFAEMHGPRNPASDHYKEYLGFLARNQYILQSGIAKVDVAVYRKEYNIDATPPFRDQSLHHAGYTYEYASPENFKLPGVSTVDGRLAPEGPAYKALVLNRVQNTTVDAAHRLVEYAKNGLPIILADLVPNGIPGFDVNGTQSVEVQDLMEQLAALPSVKLVKGAPSIPGVLASLGVMPSASIDPPSTSFYSVRRDDGPTTSHFFLYNQGTSPINVALTLVPGFEGKPFSLDPWSGQVSPVIIWNSTADGILIPDVSPAANQSLLYTVTSEASFEGIPAPSVHIASADSDLFTTANSSGPTLCSFIEGTRQIVLSNGQRRTIHFTLEGESVRELDGWQLNITKWTPPKDLSQVHSILVPLPPVNLTEGLVSWDQLEGHANTSGVGTYVTTFEWNHTPGGPVGVQLDLGVVVHTLKAWLNDAQITTADPTHPVVDISELVIQGTNRLRIGVASTLLNVVNSVPEVETLGLVRVLTNSPVPNQHYGLVSPLIFDGGQLDVAPMNEFLVQILRSSLFQQLFPFFVLFIVPFTVIFLVKSAPSPKSLLYFIVMVLESLGLVLPWNWGHGSGSTTSVTHPEKRRSKKKASKASEGVELSIYGHGEGYYPGLVNISGTYCFMNSTVQALSSLSYLQPHLDAIHEKAELLDVPTPVIDTLRDLLHRLNTSHSRPSSIRPIDLITVLSSRSGLNSLINSREHQDAQELFQLLSECIKSEITAIDKEQARDRGLGGLAQAMEHNKEVGKSVFDGLTAHRRSCVVCGYTEAVMHFPFDNWQLAVPRMASTCLLEDCLSDYTRLEVLKDCICRKCSLNATHRRLIGELETLSQVQNPTPSKKKRLKEVRKMEAKVRAALEQGRIEDELEGVRMEKVFSAMSTKQAMIARPPPVLALHINRSMHFTHYASKNNIRILFPEILDLTPFTTSGNLSIVPTSSMSTPSPPPQRSSFSPSPSVSAGSTRSRSGTPTLESQKDALSRTIYRLSAVVCHYGAHSFGHYVCFRRKPKSGVSESERWKPPKLVVETVLPDPSAVDGPDGSEESAEGFEDYVWEDSDPETVPGSGRGWLRVSDDSVTECGIESVLQEGSGAFMLYYERAIISRPPSSMTTNSIPTNGSARHESPYPISNGLKGGYQGIGVGVGTPLDSEETLKPETMTTVSSIHLNGSASVGSLISSVESGNEKVPLSLSLRAASWNGGSFGGSTSGSPPVMGARIVRNVAAGRRKRSLSAAPSFNGSISLSTSPTSSALSSSLPISSTQPIPMPNGYSRTTNSELDGFENVDHDDAAVDSSPKSPLGMHVTPQTDLLSTKLKASLSNTSLSSMTSSTSSISPPSSTVSSNAPNLKSPVRKRKKTPNSHSPSYKQAPIVV